MCDQIPDVPEWQFDDGPPERILLHTSAIAAAHRNTSITSAAIHQPLAWLVQSLKRNLPEVIRQAGIGGIFVRHPEVAGVAPIRPPGITDLEG